MRKTLKRIVAVIVLIVTVLLVGYSCYTGNRSAGYPDTLDGYKRYIFRSKDGTMVAFMDEDVWYGVGDPASKEVADAIQAASLSLMPSNRRKTKAAGSSIYLLEHIRTPAVLVECGFLSNPEEAERLSTEAYQYALAAAIFAGVVER